MATIGELTNVPEPGAGVASQWAQDVTYRIVHRYASKAALNTWTNAPDGTVAIVTDTGVEYARMAGAWCRKTPLQLSAVGAAFSGNGFVLLANLLIPADPRARALTVSYHALATIGIGTVDQDITCSLGSTNGAGGTLLMRWRPPVGGPQPSQPTMVEMTTGAHQVPPSGTDYRLEVYRPASSWALVVNNDYSFHRLTAHVSWWG